MANEAPALESDVSVGRGFLDLYVAPRSAFGALSARPRAGWLAVALLALCNGALTTLWIYKADVGAMQQQGLEERGLWARLGPDQRRDLRSQAEGARPKVVAVGTLGPPLVALGAAVACMVAFRLAFARPMPFRSALSVVAPAHLAVDIVRLLLIACAMALSHHWSQTPDAALLSSPAALLDPAQRLDPGPLFVVLQSLDLFTLWLLGLLAVGFSVTTGRPLRVTALLVAALWVGIVAFKLLTLVAVRELF